MNIEAINEGWFYDDKTAKGVSFDGLLPQACKTPLGNMPLGNTPEFELIHTPEKMAHFQNNDWYRKNWKLGDTLLTVSPLQPDKHILFDAYREEMTKILYCPCDSKCSKHDASCGACPTRGSCRGLSTLCEDVSRYGDVMTGNNALDLGKLYDVKREIYRLTDRVFAALAKCYEVDETRTFAILDQLCKKNIISSEARDQFKSASAIAIKLRLSTYLKAGKQEETSGYHMPKDEELFHFFFIAIPLYEELQKFKAGGNIPPSLTRSSFFDGSDATKGHVYCRLLHYNKAFECYDRALQQDQENLSIEIHRISIALITKVNTDETDTIRENLDTLLDKIDQSWSEPHQETTPFFNRLDLDDIQQLLEVLPVAGSIFHCPEYFVLARNIVEGIVTMKGRDKVLMIVGFLKHFRIDVDTQDIIHAAISLAPSLIDEDVSTKNILYLNSVGEILCNQRKCDKAYRCFRRALIMGQVLYGTRPNLNMMTSSYFLGVTSFSLSKNTKSEFFFESKFFFELLVERYESLDGAKARLMFKKANMMLGIYNGYYSVEESVRYLEKGLTESQNDLELQVDVALYCKLATTWHAQHNREKAWESASNAKACLAKIVDIPGRVKMSRQLAEILAKIKKTNEGIEILKEEVQKLTSQSQEKALCLMTVGKLCFKQGLATDAENYYKQALEVVVDLQDNEDSFDILKCHIRISEALKMDNRESEAKNVLDQAFILAKKLPTSSKKIRFLRDMGILWENLGDIICSKQCFDDAIRTCKELSNGTQKHLLMEFSLELKLGELGKKVYPEIAMHRSHYDRAAEALQQFVATGKFNSSTVELFLSLAVAYKSVDLSETKRLLLKTLKVCETLYGKNKLNETITKILKELLYLNLHLSSPFHERISQNLMMFALFSLKYPFVTDPVERAYEFILSARKDTASTNTTAKAAAARCFTSLGILFYTSGDLEKAETVNEMASQLFSEIHESVEGEKLSCETTCDIMKEILLSKKILPSDKKKLSVFIGEAIDALCAHGTLAEDSKTSKNCSNGRENAELFIPSSKSRKIDELINDAIRAKEDYISAIKFLDLALQLPSNWRQKTKILKLRGECYLSRGDFRTAAINFNEAARVYFSETVENRDDLCEYSEVLIGLIKSEMLCQNVAVAWLKCEEAIELVSNHEHGKSINLQATELLYLGAKCLDILSESAESKDDKLAQARSLLIQASKWVVEVRESLGGEEYLILNSEMRLLWAAIVLKLHDDPEIRLKQMQEYLDEYVVPSFYRYGESKREHLRTLYRAYSWIGRLLVMRGKMEESITPLSKSLDAFFLVALPDMLSFYEQILPLLQAITVAKSSGTSHERDFPFQQAVYMCEDVSVKNGNDLNNVYEFLKTLANLYMGLGRTEEAIVVADSGFKICDLMGDNVTDRINNRGRMLLYLAQMHQLNSTNSAFDRGEELNLAENYYLKINDYLTDQDSAAEFVLGKNVSYANFLCEQKRFADADAVLRDMNNLGKELSDKFVYCAYFSRVFYGPGIQKSVEVDGELLSTVEHCMYSTMVRVFVGMGKKREAVAACEKLIANPVVVHDTIHGKRPSSIPYLVEACHRQLLSLLSDEDQKQLQNCEFPLTPANIFKLYYMLNEYTLALEYYTNKTQSPDMIEMCSTMLRAFVEMGKKREAVAACEKLTAKPVVVHDEFHGNRPSSIPYLVEACHRELLPLLSDEDRKQLQNCEFPLSPANIFKLYYMLNEYTLALKYYTNETQSPDLIEMCSTMVRVFVEMGKKREAVAACDKLTAKPVVVHDAIDGKRPSSIPYLIEACHRELLSLLSEEHRKQLQNCEFPLSPANIFKLYYMLNEYSLALKYYTNETESPDLIEMKISCLRLAGNELVKMDRKNESRFYFLEFLRMLQTKKGFLDKPFRAQCAALSEYSFSNQYYIFRSLGEIMARERGNLDGAIQCYERCLELDEDFTLDQDLVATLADLYQSKALTGDIKNQDSCERQMNLALDLFGKLLQKTVELTPFVELSFGTLLLKLERCHEAVEHFQNVIKREDDELVISFIVYTDVQKPLVDVYLRREIEARGIITIPVKVQAFYELILTYMKLNEVGKAREVALRLENYGEHIQRTPETSLALSIVGYANKLIGNKEKAAEIFVSVLEIIPGHLCSPMVRVFVEMGKKKEAVAACEKLTANPVVVHDAIHEKRPSSITYLIETCHRDLLFLLSDEDRKQLQNCEFPLSPANIFKLYYMLNEYSLALKYYTNETQSPDLIEMKISCLCLAGNELVKMDRGNESHLYFMQFLRMLQTKEGFLDKPFHTQCATLAGYSFANQYYIFRSLGRIMARERGNLDGEIQCYERCLELDEDWTLEQDLVATLAELYQVKALTVDIESQDSYKRQMNLALDLFQKLLQKTAELTPFVECSFGSLLSKLERYHEAVEHFENIIKRTDYSFMGSKIEGVFKPLFDVYLRREIEARGSITIPVKVQAFYELILTYMKLNEVGKAQEVALRLENYVDLFERTPETSLCLSIVGYANKLIGNKEKAAEIFVSALEIIPGHLCSTMVRVFVEMGKKREAVAACEKLTGNPVVVHDAIDGKRPSSIPYLIETCHRELLSLLNDEDQKQLQNCEFPLSPANIFKLYYMLNQYTLALKYYTNETQSPDLIEMKISCLRLAGNELVEMDRGNESHSYFLEFLAMLQTKEGFMAKPFHVQRATLARYSFSNQYYIFRSLGEIMARERGNLDGAIQCYERCLQLDEDLTLDQDLVATLANLYQSKELTVDIENQDSCKRQMNLALDLFQKLLQKTAELTPFVECSFGSLLLKLGRYYEAVLHFENVVKRADHEAMDYTDVDKPLFDVYLRREIEARGSITIPLKVQAFYQLILTYMKLNVVGDAQKVALRLENHVERFQRIPKTSLFLSIVGYANKLIGNKEKAAKIFVSVLEIISGHLCSTLVRVFVEMGKKREAVAACEKLTAANPVVVHDAIDGKRPSITPYSIEACHRELFSLLSDEDQKQLQNCEFPLSPANIFKLYYMLNEYTLALKYYTNETESPDLIEMKISCLRLAGNELVEMDRGNESDSYFLEFLAMLQTKEGFFDKPFHTQCATLEGYFFANQYYIFRSLGCIMASRGGNLDGAIQCYERCLELDEDLTLAQGFAGTPLVDLYQSKALTVDIENQDSCKRQMNLALNLLQKLLQTTAELTPLGECWFGSCLLDFERYHEAVEHFENIIKREDDEPVVSVIDYTDVDKPLFDVYLHREVEVRGSIAIPVKVQAFYALILTYMKLNEVGKAQEVSLRLEDYVERFQFTPEYSLILSTVGYANKVIGNKEKAAEIFVSVLEINPGHLPVTEALESLCV
jgi:tetratricopeptide (TPR) repeat protein